MSTESINPRHEGNIIDKAVRFVSFLQEHGGALADAEVLAETTGSDALWRRITELKNEARPDEGPRSNGYRETVPRPSTRAAIVSLFALMTANGVNLSAAAQAATTGTFSQ